MADSELRYTFACPSCAGSFSISIERIPPVRARFSCPKCGKSMDFPAREEARVYMMLQPGTGAGEGGSQPVPEPPLQPTRPAVAAAPPSAPEPPPAKPQETPPPTKPPEPPPPAKPPEPPVPVPASDAEKRYTVQKGGFEGDSFDRRAIRILIRTGSLDPGDSIRLGDAPAVRVDELADLKSLFELRKNARFTPPAVCRKHTDVLAHYVCGDTGRPICDDCAPEKKFGGTSVRVCDHCGGTARDLHAAPGDLS